MIYFQPNFQTAICNGPLIIAIKLKSKISLGVGGGRYQADLSPKRISSTNNVASIPHITMFTQLPYQQVTFYKDEVASTVT
jgi:hypothetical protein